MWVNSAPAVKNELIVLPQDANCQFISARVLVRTSPQTTGRMSARRCSPCPAVNGAWSFCCHDSPRVGFNEMNAGLPCRKPLFFGRIRFTNCVGRPHSFQNVCVRSFCGTNPGEVTHSASRPRRRYSGYLSALNRPSAGFSGAAPVTGAGCACVGAFLSTSQRITR